MAIVTRPSATCSPPWCRTTAPSQYHIFALHSGKSRVGPATRCQLPSCSPMHARVAPLSATSWRRRRRAVIHTAQLHTGYRLRVTGHWVTGYRLLGYDLRVTGLVTGRGLCVMCYGLWVTGYGLRVMGCGLWITSCGLRVSGLWVMGYGLRVSGVGGEIIMEAFDRL